MAISSGVRRTLCALLRITTVVTASIPRTRQSIRSTAAVLGALLALPFTAGAATRNIWITQAEIDALPTNTAAYTRVLSAANATWPKADISVQENNCGAYVMAGALVWMKTRQVQYRAKVRDSIMAAIRSCPIRAGVIQNAYSYSPHRFLPGYAAAADMIDLQSFAPDSDAIFRGYIDSVRWVPLKQRNASEGSSILQMHEISAAAGAGPGGSRIACSAYLGDAQDLARCNSFFRAYSDQSYYPAGTVKFPPGANAGDYFDKGTIGSWIYEPTWICGDTASWTVISPACIKTDPADGDTATIDGALVCQLSRLASGGPAEPFTWPPNQAAKMYQWTNLNYLFIQSEFLYRVGYTDIYSHGNQSLKRCMNMMIRSGSPYGPLPEFASANWVAWVSNRRYGTNHPTAPCITSNWSVYWTDWTHSSVQADAIPPASIGSLSSP